jgi:threonine-phosphate decarboxylase
VYLLVWPLHGSNPHYLYRAAGIDLPNEIFDFSANINPLGPPSSIKERWSDFLEDIEK